MTERPLHAVAWEEPGTGTDDQPEPLDLEPGTDVAVTDDAELVPIESQELVAVDPPDVRPNITVRVLAAMDAERQPIIPTWLRSWDDFSAIATWMAGYAWYLVAFHTVRSWLYAARVAWRAPQGVGAVLRGIGSWVLDTQVNPLLEAAVRRDDPGEYDRIARRRDDHRRSRSILLLVGLAAGLVLAAVLVVWWLRAPWWWARPAELAAGLVGVLWLAWVGSPMDQPILSRATDAVEAPRRLTSEMIERAFQYIGIGELTRALKPGGQGLGFPEPIRMDEGARGWRADIDLPYGVIPQMVMEKRQKLASALRRPLGTVWPEGDPDVHEGRLILRVLHKDLAKQKQPMWPLSKAGRTFDFFDRYPFGWDVRGRLVSLPLFEANMLVGAQPGEGKSASIRPAVCAAALDPTCQLWIVELAGKGDFSEFERISHVYVNGLHEEAIAAAAQMLADLREECERRLTVFGTRVPTEMKPDKKLTREIANRKVWGLHPILAVLDECQNLFSHKTHGKQAAEDAEVIMRLTRAVGIHLVLATQRPDSGSVPTGVTAMAHIRFCLRVLGQTENDMILGTSAYKNGHRATTFRHATDAGVGILIGGEDLPVVVRAAYLDGPAVEKIVRRAHAARVAAGTITGHAAGQTPKKTQDRYQLLRDLLAVWPPDQDRMWSQELCPLLEDTFPDRWTRLDPDRLAGLLGLVQVETRQMQKTVDGERNNRRGLDLSTVQDALKDRTPVQTETKTREED